MGIRINTKMVIKLMNIQKRIKELMAERNWSDYRLAKEANLSSSTVSNMFRRNNAPTLPTLESVCKSFDMTLAEFFATNQDELFTEEQRLLLSRWNTLTEKQRHYFLCLMGEVNKTK